MASHSERLRSLPSVDRVLQTADAARALANYRRAYVIDHVRAAIESARRALAMDGPTTVPSADDIMATALEQMRRASAAPMRRVVNATGVVLHTNLGRALLAEEAITAAVAVARDAANLEYDLDSGDRGDRDAAVAADLCAFTGAAAATVVNNNAAAVLLALNTLAEGREVIVSRGELIEIGGSFRIPDVMAKSQALLREVGTTNRTHPKDYAGAINERSALLLKVHTSNYRIVGFTSEVSLAELVELGRQHGLPVMEDLGSGALVDLSQYGLPKEPVVAERIAAGADLVTFSGDKLLGGPQAGLIVGRADLVERIRRNPLKRALRCDKLTLAALAATLHLYRSAPDLREGLPTLRWLTRPLAEIEAIGRAALPRLKQALGEDFVVALVDSQAEVGSGALPEHGLPSKALSVRHGSWGVDDIAKLFRNNDPPIIGRIHDAQFLLDLRGVFAVDDVVPHP